MSWPVKSLSNNKSAVRLVTVAANREGQRLDNYLTAQLKGVPRAAIYRMIRTGQVRINGGRCKPSSRLSEGDKVRIPPVRVTDRGNVRVSEKVCRQIDTAIVYEDHDLIVVDKPSGMAVHSGSGLPWGLIDVVRQIRPGQDVELVHRIDRETSGCILLAKSGQALRHLSTQFRIGAVRKEYLCLLGGVMKEASIEVDVPVRKTTIDGDNRVAAGEGGKPATTRFRMLQVFPSGTYAEAELLTGRTHQIRVHAKFLGMPLAGDQKYASATALELWKKRGLNRLFLHAHRLRLESRPGEPMAVNSTLPEDLRSVLSSLEKGQ
jgi:23S rRNA pseudouridine955/2504/2580 synthase